MKKKVLNILKWTIIGAVVVTAAIVWWSFYQLSGVVLQPL